MKKISNRKGKKIKKYIYTMSLIFISIKKFFQLHPALGEVPTCFKMKKQNLVKNQPKKTFDKEEKKKNMIYNTFVLVQDIPSFGHPS